MTPIVFDFDALHQSLVNNDVDFLTRHNANNHDQFDWKPLTDRAHAHMGLFGHVSLNLNDGWSLKHSNSYDLATARAEFANYVCDFAKDMMIVDYTFRRVAE